MSRPRKPAPEIPGYWKDALPQKTGVRPGIPVPAKGEQSAGKRTRSRNVFIRYLFVACFFASVGAVVWLAFDTRPVESRELAVPGGPYEIDFHTDGVIPKAFIVEKLGGEGARMPPIFDAKRRLEAVSQIREVVVKRVSDDKLSVTVYERTPIARLYAMLDGVPVNRFVSSEGVVYEPVNLDEKNERSSMMLRNMPILTGVKLVKGADYDYIDGFAPVSDFLNLAREKYRSVYGEWQQLSLANYPGKPDAPGALFRVKPRLNSRSPDAAVLSEILFSPVDYASELRQFAECGGLAAIEPTLRAVDRSKYREYVLDLSLVDESTPRMRTPQFRLIPVPPAASRP